MSEEKNTTSKRTQCSLQAANSLSLETVRRRNNPVALAFSRSCLPWQSKGRLWLLTDWLISGSVTTRCVVNNHCYWTANRDAAISIYRFDYFVQTHIETWSRPLSCLSFYGCELDWNSTVMRLWGEQKDSLLRGLNSVHTPTYTPHCLIHLLKAKLRSERWNWRVGLEDCDTPRYKWWLRLITSVYCYFWEILHSIPLKRSLILIKMTFLQIFKLSLL